MPKISIITPTYNSGKFINRTITSVLNQTHKDWEFLIVDDCSTDNTIEIVNKFIKQDSRIKLLKNTINSGGPALPKNIGIENASGEYVAFLDHDDEWLPEKLEKQLKVFEESKSDILGLVSCFVNIRDNNGKLLYRHKKNYKGNVIRQLANGNFIVTSSCVMTKLSILKEIGLFDSSFKTSDDLDMWLRISNLGYTFDFIPEYLVNYISHGSNTHMGNEKRNDEKEFDLMYNKHKESFKKYSLKSIGHYYFYKKEYPLARKYFIQSIFSNKSNLKQKIKSFAFIILTFYPNLERFFRNALSKIKTLYKF